MANEAWPEVRLGNLCKLQAGSVFPPALQGKAHGTYPFAKVSDMNLAANMFCIRDANNWVDDADLQQMRAKPFPAGTTVFAKIGEGLKQNRLRYLVRETVIDNNMMGATPDTARLDPRFFVYALSRFNLGEIAGGTALPYLTVSALSDLTLPLLPLPEQRAIAHTLGALDDKIELNRRMSETLEATARAIFKSWFVDLDPVRAKAEGRQPFGMDAETALSACDAQAGALFPDSFLDSPLGKIPKGWKAVPLPEIVEVNPSRSLSKGQKATYLDMQNMPTRGHRPANWISRPFVSGSRFVNGDTLLARITPCLENGKTAFVDFLKDGEVGWGSTEFIVLHPKDPLPPEYGYCLARDEDFRTHAIQNMTGSSGRQRVPTDSLAQYWVVAPPEPIALCFGKAIRPLFAKVKTNSEESATLAAIRDALLPKLISGEIRVKDAEKYLEAGT
jgi:type I restriction enzyme S subunit